MKVEYRDDVLPLIRTCGCGAEYDGPDVQVLADGWHRGAKYGVNAPVYTRDDRVIHVTTVQPVAICPVCHEAAVIRKISKEYRADYKGATWGT